MSRGGIRRESEEVPLSKTVLAPTPAGRLDALLSHLQYHHHNTTHKPPTQTIPALTLRAHLRLVGKERDSTENGSKVRETWPQVPHSMVERWRPWKRADRTERSLWRSSSITLSAATYSGTFSWFCSFMGSLLPVT